MSKLLLKNLTQLLGASEAAPAKLAGEEMKKLPCIENAWLAVEDGRVADFGEMASFPGITDWKDLEIMDCSGQIVMPCFADSHTHLVYAGNREQEFIDRINGLSYEEIAARGGGILNSVAKLRSCSEEELYQQSYERFREVITLGTGAIEIKSGYGLDLESELKILRVIRRLRDLELIPVKATFLGAHAVPSEFKGDRSAYVRFLIKELLPAVAAEKLADFIDVFCEKNYFDAAETTELLQAGQQFGLQGKVHAEQLSHSGGIAAAVKAGAISVDHLEYCSDADISLLKDAATIPTVLPGAAYFLGLPLPPARKMIDAGLAVAFASDYNPGSSPSGNMMQMMSMACVQYRLNPEEAINAVTINSAAAMDCAHLVGTLSLGKLANFIVTRPINSYGYLPYAFGSQLISSVYIKGKVQQ